MSPIMDDRIKPINRTIILTIVDNYPIPFSSKDLEWIAEVIEDKLRNRFDIVIENIEIK